MRMMLLKCIQLLCMLIIAMCLTNFMVTNYHRMKELQLYRSLRPWLESKLIWDTFSYGKEEQKLITILHAFTNEVKYKIYK